LRRVGSALMAIKQERGGVSPPDLTRALGLIEWANRGPREAVYLKVFESSFFGGGTSTPSQ
jgi:hypothetical protein